MAEDKFDLTEVKQTVTEVARGFEQLKATLEEKNKEFLTRGSVDTLLEEKLRKINDTITEQQALLDKVTLAAKRSSITVDGQSLDMEELNAKSLAWANACARARGTQISEYSYENVQEYKKAFNRYIRKDDRILSAEEQKALSVGSDPDGGYVVDPDTTGRIIRRQFETSPVRAYASVQVISTDALEGLFDLDEADCGWVNETATRTETDTPELATWRIPVHEMYAEPRATQKLLDDAYIDMEEWLSTKVADKFSRTENNAFVVGNGVGKPRGFLSYAEGTTIPGQIETVKTGVNGGFAAAPNGGDVLINVQGKLKSNYRQNAAWFMNRTTQAAVRLLKNSDGDYIWQPGLQIGQPASLLGAPIVSFEDMPSHTVTGAFAIAYGDLREAYQIVDRIGIRVLRDPFTAKPWVKFYTTKRVGGDVVNFEAIKIVKFAS